MLGGLPLYKYLPDRFARDAVYDGLFRIGTLFDYRREEAYGQQIGDSQEGTKIGSHFIRGRQVVGNLGPDEAFVAKFLMVEPGAVLDGCHFRQVTESQNFWLYCTSLSRDESLFNEFGANRCLRFTEPVRFMAVLTRELHLLGLAKGSGTIAQCVYRERTGHYSEMENLDPATLKDYRYHAQCEVRTRWEMRDQSLSPLVIHCPDARQFLEFADF